MTQQNPGQPYIPPSAGSAPGAFNTQQPAQYQAGGAAGSYPAPTQPGQYQQAGQYQQPGIQPGAGYPPAGGSFFSSLFDTSVGFVDRHGKTVFILFASAALLLWLYNAIAIGHDSGTANFNGDSFSREFNVLRFLFHLLANAPWTAALIGLARLFIELVRNSAGSNRTGA